MKLLKTLALTAGILLLPGFVGVGNALETNYNKVIEVQDWGSVVTKLVVYLGETIPAAKIESDSFEVKVSRSDTRVPGGLALPQQDEKVTVLEVYISDAEGNRAAVGEYATLALLYKSGQNSGDELIGALASVLNYADGFNRWVDGQYTITQKKPIGKVTDLYTNTLKKTYRPQIDLFNTSGNIREGDVTLTYADFRPSGLYRAKTVPLLVWLHGGGEGGTDATIPLAANKAVAFASPEVQKIFGGALYVLVPQTPTRWMEEAGEATADPAAAAATPTGPITSIYTAATKALIQKYVDQNKAIDPDRIYIGGLSNGGYLTQLLIMDDPTYFAAAVPVASAALDARITDEQIDSILDLPIWYVNAAKDDTVPAVINSLATYDRLIKKGASRVYYSYPADVRAFEPDGVTVVYPGHWSWIYVYNNALTQRINDVSVNLLDWLAAQSRNLAVPARAVATPAE
ncbi:hypothetical protein FACS1894172_12450 [Spirochaetia bacterium]|nr:hypothetical protein FACS1894164_16430 [Spirochaetia bacterium]GHU33606.1 hypothetical protein FACS1894172_12450 [Spirochaetia bacterium]